MTATVHVLKTTTAYFAAVWSGEKTFEVRYDDRGYQRGHQVRLREFDPTKPCEVCPRVPGEAWHTGPDCEKYSGREVHADIGHVMASTPQPSKVRPGFNGHGYVVFSLLNVGTFDRSASASDAEAIAAGERLILDIFGGKHHPAAVVVTATEAAHRIAKSTIKRGEES